jgi:hypothetical protein
MFSEAEMLDIRNVLHSVRDSIPGSNHIGWLYYYAGFIWGNKKAVRVGDADRLDFMWQYSLMMYSRTNKYIYKKGCLMMLKILKDSVPAIAKLIRRWRTYSETGRPCTGGEWDLLRERVSAMLIPCSYMSQDNLSCLQGQREWKESIDVVSRSRLIKRSQMFNVLRRNSKNIDEAYNMERSSDKKYVTDFRETITMVADHLGECFGTDRDELIKPNCWNELAHVTMKPEDVTWIAMLNARPSLRSYVDLEVSKGDLWIPPPATELQKMEEQDIIDLTRDDGLDGVDDDLKDDNDDGDDPEPMATLATHLVTHQVHHWLQKTKPMKGESEDEYAARCMFIVERGQSHQGRMVRMVARGATAPKVEDSVSLGTAARKFFEEVQGGPSERKPTRICESRDSGAQGTIYKVEWRGDKGYTSSIPVFAWKKLDWVQKYDYLLENFNKVHDHDHHQQQQQHHHYHHMHCLCTLALLGSLISQSVCVAGTASRG